MIRLSVTPGIKELLAGSLLKVNQYQIIFPMVTKCLLFEKKITMTSSRDPLIIREKVSGYLRHFRPCRITIR